VVYYGNADVPAFRVDRPVLLVRAGRDSPGLNRGLDALAAQALRENAPVEVLSLPSAVHGFDIRDDSEFTRAAIARTLDFLESTLRGPLTASIRSGAAVAEAAAATFREDWKAAVIAYGRLVESQPADPILWERLGEARRGAGDRSGALAALEKARTLGTPNQGYVGFAIARLHAEAGDVDLSLTTLEKIKDWLRFLQQDLRTAPEFAAVRRDPRFEKLMAAMPPPPK
jgi:dienelactone hydrolase